MGILARLGLALTRWTERWVPDSWIIAVMLWWSRCWQRPWAEPR
jgi:hypothetical protein